MDWVISANGKKYNHMAAFRDRGYIDWRQTANYEVGDIVYIYFTKSIQKIMVKAYVERVDMVFNKYIDDEEYWYDKEEYEKSKTGKYARIKLLEEIDSEKLTLEELKKHGLTAAPRGPIRAPEELAVYLKEVFEEESTIEKLPEEIDDRIEEGHIKRISVNKYERSRLARKKCIQKFGANCVVCQFNFEQFYGEMGKDYIHVHHVVPLHTIKKTYRVNYETDLVPVCPNCHAMLHKKINGKEPSVEELKKIISENRNFQETIY